MTGLWLVADELEQDPESWDKAQEDSDVQDALEDDDDLWEEDDDLEF